MYDNGARSPMSFELYDEYMSRYFDTYTHRLLRQEWLWNNFIKYYDQEFWENYSDNYMSSQQIIFQLSNENDRPLKWRYWEMWKKYFLIHQGIPGELPATQVFPSFCW